MSQTKDFLKKIVLTQAQFSARQSAGTLQEGVEYEISDALDSVEDVKIYETSVVNSTTHVATIPLADNNTYGVVMADPGRGTRITAGKLEVIAAIATEIESKSNSARLVGCDQIDRVIRAGLGNYNATKGGAWNDTEKAAARNTIGCIAMAEYDATAASYAENTLYYVVED